MADVFISYARPDRPQAERLARALQVAGFTVWWDLEDLRSGESFNRAVQQALKEARCVVVLWSGTSVKSEYVEAEAYWAWKQKKLHSVRLDDALDLPVPFNTSHSLSLASWDGSPGHAAFQRQSGDIASAIGRPQPKQERGPEAEPASTPPPQPATAKQPDQPRPRTLTSVGSAPQPEHGPEPECENAEAPTPPPRRPSPIILALSALAGIAALVAMVVVMSPKGPDPRGTEDARTETPAEQRRDPESVPAWVVEPPEMATVSAGSFEMGCVSGKGCQGDELPVRTVTFDKPFAIGKYEVTFAEYDRFAEATGKERPSDEGWGRGSRPAINVTWKDAAAYADWLSNQTRGRYRLPTEAEWEYAARADSRTPWSFGDREDALGQ